MEIKKKIIDIVRDRKTQIPTLPVIVEKILSIARDERTSAKDLSEFIEKDQAISNKILKIANSAYYGLMREVDSIQRSITVIGFNEVISLTIGMSVFSAFSQTEEKAGLGLKDLWLHAIGCATAAKEISKYLRADVGQQIFLNGLLHDMGKVIFVLFFPEEYKAVLEETKKGDNPLYRVEKKMLGIHHADLSGLLMERWHFPENLVLPARFHHNAIECPSDFRTNAMIVEIANAVCHKAGVGFSGNAIIPATGRVRQQLGMDQKDYEAMVANVEEQKPQIEEFFTHMS